MSSIHILTGRLTKDPLSKTQTFDNKPSTKTVVTVVSTRYNPNGDDFKQYHRVRLVGQPAMFLANFGKKGTLVQIQGEVQNQQFTNEKGEEVRYTETYVSQRIGGAVQILSQPNQQNQTAQAQTAQATPQAQMAQQPQAQAMQQPQAQAMQQPQPQAQTMDFDDDIPF